MNDVFTQNITLFPTIVWQNFYPSLLQYIHNSKYFTTALKINISTRRIWQRSLHHKYYIHVHIINIQKKQRNFVSIASSIRLFVNDISAFLLVPVLFDPSSHLRCSALGSCHRTLTTAWIARWTYKLPPQYILHPFSWYKILNNTILSTWKLLYVSYKIKSDICKTRQFWRLTCWRRTGFHPAIQH